MSNFFENSQEILYKITFDNAGDFNSYKIINANTYLEFDNEEINKHIDNFDPYTHKLFNGDVFKIIENNIEIVHSNIRNLTSIQGILISNGNKNYGRVHKKYLYKCIPDDIRLPHFIVPFEIQGKTFTKHFKNKYINFTFDNWNSKNPVGKLFQTIGDVDKLENFYEYQLFCKSLNSSSINKFTKQSLKILKEKTFEEYFEIIKINHPELEDRRNYNVFTIDGKGTLDFDDAISYKYDEIKKQDIITIYITNVSLWLEVLDLWDSFSQRVSTIYLPDKKKPMLPNILSDCLCSLQENQNRYALAIDIIIDEKGHIKDVKFLNVIINVFKNFIYEESDLKNNNQYIDILNCVKKLSQIHNLNNNYKMKIKNSYDVIAYLMILTNYYTGKVFTENSNGIYRTTSIKNSKEQMTIVDKIEDEELSKFINIWNTNAGEYTTNSQETNHCILGLDAYVHITSPIRRIVDLINLIILQQNKYLCVFSDKVNKFVKMWISKIDYINITMRAIRKVQTKCNLLHLIDKTPQIETIIHKGYLFDKAQRDDGLFQYMTYIPELKILSKITTRIDKENFDVAHFNIYAFNEEDSFKKKIRIQII